MATEPQPVSDEPLSEIELILAAESAARNADQMASESRLVGEIEQARASGNRPQIATPFPEAIDWRVRLSLAPGSNYLYNAENPGILLPLKSTRGVLFPYTPQITISHSANYDSSDLAHTNYKLYNYKNSSVDNISITADFTAQDVSEANYVLAVIHFFRSVTKMFYGKDTNPIRGVPPPLVYITGHGAYNFDNQALAITNFTMTYPNDVDYISAGNNITFNSALQAYKPVTPFNNTPLGRLFSSFLRPGGGSTRPQSQVGVQQSGGVNSSVTRVPTKLTIQLSAIPIVSRQAVSNQFSLQEYATGKLIRGSINPGGGFW